MVLVLQRATVILPSMVLSGHLMDAKDSLTWDGRRTMGASALSDDPTTPTKRSLHLSVL